MVALRYSALCCFRLSWPRNGAAARAPLTSNELRLVWLGRLWEQGLDCLERSRRLRSTLLLKLVHPVAHRANHVACSLLGRFPGILGLFARLLAVSVLALDHFYRFLSHTTFTFLLDNCSCLLSLNEFCSSEFIYYSIERL